MEGKQDETQRNLNTKCSYTTILKVCAIIIACSLIGLGIFYCTKSANTETNHIEPQANNVDIGKKEKEEMIGGANEEEITPGVNGKEINPDIGQETLPKKPQNHKLTFNLKNFPQGEKLIVNIGGQDFTISKDEPTVFVPEGEHKCEIKSNPGKYELDSTVSIASGENHMDIIREGGLNNQEEVIKANEEPVTTNESLTSKFQVKFSEMVKNGVQSTKNGVQSTKNGVQKFIPKVFGKIKNGSEAGLKKIMGYRLTILAVLLLIGVEFYSTYNKDHKDWKETYANFIKFEGKINKLIGKIFEYIRWALYDHLWISLPVISVFTGPMLLKQAKRKSTMVDTVHQCASAVRDFIGDHLWFSMFTLMSVFISYFGNDFVF